MAKISIHTRVILNGKPGTVTGLKKSSADEHGLDYEVTLDVGSDTNHVMWCQLDNLLREDGKRVKRNPLTLRSYIDVLERKHRAHKMEADSFTPAVLSYDETFIYGKFVGKCEMLDDIIKKLKKIKK